MQQLSAFPHQKSLAQNVRPMQKIYKRTLSKKPAFQRLRRASDAKQSFVSAPLNFGKENERLHTTVVPVKEASECCYYNNVLRYHVWSGGRFQLPARYERQFGTAWEHPINISSLTLKAVCLLRYYLPTLFYLCDLLYHVFWYKIVPLTSESYCKASTNYIIIMKNSI